MLGRGMHSRGKRLECPAWPQSQPGDHASHRLWAGGRYPESTPMASSAASQRPLLGNCVRNITGSFLPSCRKPSPTCTTDTQGCLHPTTRGHRWSSGLLTTHVKRAQAETLFRAGSRKNREELAVLTPQGSRAPSSVAARGVIETSEGKFWLDGSRPLALWREVRSEVSAFDWGALPSSVQS